METFKEDMFEFRKARIVGGDEGAGIGVMGKLRGLDGLSTLLQNVPVLINTYVVQ